MESLQIIAMSDKEADEGCDWYSKISVLISLCSELATL